MAWYKLAFRILRYAIIYRGLGALRGDNQAHALLPRDTALTIAVPTPAAWHIGGLAGYGDDATRSFKRRCSALRSHSKSR